MKKIVLIFSGILVLVIVVSTILELVLFKRSNSKFNVQNSLNSVNSSNSFYDYGMYGENDVASSGNKSATSASNTNGQYTNSVNKTSGEIYSVFLDYKIALVDEEYETAYDMLEPNFKKQNFPTLNSFINYVNDAYSDVYLTDNTEFIVVDYQNDGNGKYTCKIEIDDTESGEVPDFNKVFNKQMFYVTFSSVAEYKISFDKDLVFFFD